VKAAPPLRDLPLGRVDLDQPLVPAFLTPDLTGLADSLRAVGLLSPPWLRARVRGRFQVVAGQKRLLAAAQLGWKQAPAYCLPANVAHHHCLLVYLHDNAFTRGFNLSEQAWLASRLFKGRDRREIAAPFLPLLGQPPSARVVDRLLALAGLEGAFQVLAAQGRLALTAAAVLAGWGVEDRAAIRPVLEGLPLTQSQQEEILEGLELLARREGVAPAVIWHRLGLQSHLEDPTLTPPEKVRAVRRVLARMVSPRLSAAREAFAAALGKLGLRDHPRVRLAPPPAFEGDDFRLEVRFRDAQELRGLLKELERWSRTRHFLDLEGA
jgi:ParB family chromosome partitioning protein